MQYLHKQRSATSAVARLKETVRHLHIPEGPAHHPRDAMSSRPLKILMLHGYTQNGPLFHAKTKVLEKFLLKVFPGTIFAYPTGPMRLRPSEIPGADASSMEGGDDLSEHYGWWRRSNTAEPPDYVGIDYGLGVIAKLLRDEGPFDGVMGFSQGAAAAVIVASLLEPNRRSAFEAAKQKSKYAIDFPASFVSLEHPPLKFCVAYCGFPAAGERYQALYEPHVTTSMCHVVGTLDSVVEEDRTQRLVDATGGAARTTVIMHPGGHFVPSGKQYVEAVAGFIKSSIEGTRPKTKSEENVEDMDVPF